MAEIVVKRKKKQNISWHAITAAAEPGSFQMDHYGQLPTFNNHKALHYQAISSILWPDKWKILDHQQANYYMYYFEGQSNG